MTILSLKLLLALSSISAFCLGTGVADTCPASSSVQCIPGLPGRDGQPGPPGPSGLNGHNGRDGATGAPGPLGPPGFNGTNGQQGPPGPQGPQGPVGEQGMKGERGELGQAGSDGRDGVDGAPGRDGTDGLPGPTGTLSDAVIEQLREDILEDVQKLLFCKITGITESSPATSCEEIYKCNSTAPSGYYWVRSGVESATRVFCMMNTTDCGTITGGWMRAAYINMSDGANQSCPVGLITYTQSSTRFCGTSIYSAGCTSVNFSTYGVPFTKVCGRALGYQYGSTDAFYNSGSSIESYYVEGLSVTHGTPRNHIWTFAVGFSKDYSYTSHNCPCASPYPGPAAPPFVGHNYFCESGNNETYSRFWHIDDPLWDSQGCTSGSTCCDRGGPWFNTTLSREVSDDIEVRWCTAHTSEDIGVGQLEIYVN